jgi:hypothetical protein
LFEWSACHPNTFGKAPDLNANRLNDFGATLPRVALGGEGAARQAALTRRRPGSGLVAAARFRSRRISRYHRSLYPHSGGACPTAGAARLFRENSWR